MKRIKTLIEKFSGIGIDAFLITAVENVTYLSGFRGDSSHLIISSNGCCLITDGRYTEQAQMECHKDIEIVTWIDNKRYGAGTYQHIIDTMQIRHLGFESQVLTHADYEKLTKGIQKAQLVPVGNIIDALRQIKDSSEIDFLRNACKISDKALELTIPVIKPGITEMEIAAELEYNMKTNGAEDISFQTIVLSGAKTSLLHGRPDTKKINPGDFILFDFGALYHGYHADISRTFVVGKPNEQQKEIYSIIQKAQSEAVQCLKDGIEGFQPDAIVRSVIPEKYIQYYYPGLGHGVGLQIHEQPFIKGKVDFTLKSGMVITIEPGIYIPGWGGLRIEDTVLIQPDGQESLTHFDRNLTEL
jgi:Xaa-Pro aminopeptidase